MRNWSVDTSRFEKNSKEYEIRQLEQLLDFCMSEGETIERKQLEKYLPVLATGIPATSLNTCSMTKNLLTKHQLDFLGFAGKQPHL